MDDSRDRMLRARQEFDRLYGVDPRAREIALAQLRDHDPLLAEEVESLFEASAAAYEEHFLYPPPDGSDPEEDSARHPDPFPPGSRIGPYLVERFLGRGGMGRVYLARDPRDPAWLPVALKLMRSRATVRWFQQFQAERRLLSQLVHPNIVRLIDDGSTTQGAPYLVMEFVDGQPLDEYCQARDLSHTRKAGLVLQVARGVAHAHRQGILHRDLKPANILVTPDGTPKITDFGLARPLEEADRSASPYVQGTAFGTASYMTPQLILGETQGRATDDCYSLGAILYRLLVGRAPFESSTLLETCVRATSEEIRSPRRDDPGIPRDLDTIVLEAMSHDPASRFSTADQLAEQLQRFVDGRPLTIRRRSDWRRALRRWIGRRRGRRAR